MLRTERRPLFINPKVDQTAWTPMPRGAPRKVTTKVRCPRVTPILRPNGVHTLMCAQRSITHKLTNYKGCIITNVITS
jgi:hypothetical protein